MDFDKEDVKKMYALLAEHEKKEQEEKKKNEEQILFEKEPLRNLIHLSWITFGTLAVFIVSSAILISERKPLKIEPIWVCIIAGILGSTSAALLSALERKANGWENKNGNKYPKDEPKYKFSERIATFFLFRPVFGILAGLLVYFGMQSKAIGKLQNDTNPDIIFFSLVAGLFIKLLIEKLKDIIDGLLKIK